MFGYCQRLKELLSKPLKVLHHLSAFAVCTGDLARLFASNFMLFMHSVGVTPHLHCLVMGKVRYFRE